MWLQTHATTVLTNCPKSQRAEDDSVTIKQLKSTPTAQPSFLKPQTVTRAVTGDAAPPNPGLTHLIGPHPQLMVLAESKEKGVVIEAVDGEADRQVGRAAVTSENTGFISTA